MTSRLAASLAAAKNPPFDFVVMDVGLRPGQPDGLGVGDEMHLVTALGQLQSELGGNHATAAIGGITRNADSHGWCAPSECAVPRVYRYRRLDGFEARGIQRHVTERERAVSLRFEEKVVAGTAE